MASFPVRVSRQAWSRRWGAGSQSPDPEDWASWARLQAAHWSLAPPQLTASGPALGLAWSDTGSRHSRGQRALLREKVEGSECLWPILQDRADPSNQSNSITGSAVARKSFTMTRYRCRFGAAEYGELHLGRSLASSPIEMLCPASALQPRHTKRPQIPERQPSCRGLRPVHCRMPDTK